MTITPAVSNLRYSSDAMSAMVMTYSGGLSLPSHAHELAGFAYMFRGEYVERYDHIAFRCRKGVMTYSPPSTPHSNTFADGPCSCLIIELEPRLLVDLELQDRL